MLKCATRTGKAGLNYQHHRGQRLLVTAQGWTSAPHDVERFRFVANAHIMPPKALFVNRNRVARLPDTLTQNHPRADQGNAWQHLSLTSLPSQDPAHHFARSRARHPLFQPGPVYLLRLHALSRRPRRRDARRLADSSHHRHDAQRSVGLVRGADTARSDQ